MLKLHHSDIAKEHRISPGYVSCLQIKALKNKNFIAELMSKRDEKEVLRKNIKTVIEQMNQDDEFIDSVRNLKENLESKHQIIGD